MGKMAVIVVLAAFVIFYIIVSPNNAADIASGGWDAIVNIAHGVGNFIDKLSS